MEHTIGQPHGRESRSPWSRCKGKQEVRIVPPQSAITANITIPGSKSLTNRALIIAALAEGSSRLEGILRSDDSYWCIESLRQLGVHIEVEEETAVIHGTGGDWPNREGELYFGAAGTIARFLPGALAAGRGTWKLQGNPRLSERPLAPLLDALSALGADIRYEAEQGRLPLTLHANGLRGGGVSIAGNVSSQFISGLLLAAPYAREPLTVQIEGAVVQRDYVEMTLDMMRAFGIEAEPSTDGQSVLVQPGKYQAQSLALEPDVSTCCYFWSLAAQTNGRVRIEGISDRTRQPDIEILDVLERMGCTVVRGDGFIEVAGPPRLKGGFTASMKRWSDQTLTIAALAPFADAPITLTDAAHIRHHECDRIAAICTELGKLGIRVEEHPDGLTVYPGKPQPALLDTYDDHRVAMALSLIAVKADGIRIADPGCVSKTCPDYWDRLSALGVEVTLS
ncbi:3-phosphoshikimate 1-carboxyvinyltransferase [Paenibacillus sp. OAS669]|uniref:3-phosphoshikimate 1-carboxyvinyltransferase n=1 Tax=Paenibacillus sp. OAS669 TaxID=2663821 RepID=UPI00178A72AF|nr:3-phosphoshikimate 1-carboxyvinyltransferase [Paenibacillus sp. OAS669]MBE1443679.1 3-phosphoshikimate 1-carboxyvinyltransferase [Paenibacillus sp. OAS669]